MSNEVQLPKSISKAFIDKERAYSSILRCMLVHLRSRQQEWFHGMPKGTDHSYRHLDQVATNVIALMGGAKMVAKLPSHVRALLGLSAYAHDALLSQGRGTHGDVEVLSKYLLDLFSGDMIQTHVKDSDIHVIAQVCAAHTGRDGLQRLYSMDSGHIYFLDGETPVVLVEIAAVVRFADELAEGRERADKTVIAEAKDEAKKRARYFGENEPVYDRTYAYHMLSTVLEFKKIGGKEVDCLINGSMRELTQPFYHICDGEFPRGRSFVYRFVFERIQKTARELSYCAVFFPRQVKTRRIRCVLRIDGRSLGSNVVVDPEMDIWKFFRDDKGKVNFLTPMKHKRHLAVTSIELSQLIRDTVVDSCLGLYGNILRSLVLFGSVAEGTASPDIDLCAILDDRIEAHCPPRPLIREVLSGWEDHLGLAISLDEIPADDAISRFLVGDPFMVAVVQRGACLINSTYHWNLKLLASQKIAFPARRLLPILLEFLVNELISCRNSQGNLDMERLKSIYRGYCLCFQIGWICTTSEKLLPIDFCVKLSKVARYREFNLALPFSEGTQSQFDAVTSSFKNRDVRGVDMAAIQSSLECAYKTACEAYEQFSPEN